jgi:hypothetical protein
MLSLVADEAMMIALGGVALGLLVLVLALRAGSRRRLIDNTPTCKTTGVFIGMVELKGTAEADGPLISYLTAAPCVYYRWSVQEHWSRTVTETYTDSQGKRQTRTREESGWTTVAEGAQETLFYIRDDCGIVRIDPQGAKIEPDLVFSQTCHRGDPLYYDKGPSTSICDSDHRRLFEESAIGLHRQLFVVGHARERADVIAPEIAAQRGAPMFLISTRNQQQVSRGLNAQFWCLGVLSIILATAGWVIRDASGEHGPQIVDPAQQVPMYIGIAAIAVGAWLAGWFWMAYNSMVNLRQRVAQAWSNVDVQLKLRADLIPNIVSVVAGLRDYEQTVQKEVTLLRSQAAATAPGQPGPDPQGCLPALGAIVEQYPELTANTAFLALQRQLTQIEQRIALARTYFNEIAAFYNTRLQILPDRFVCQAAGLKPQPFIAAEDFQRARIQVNLAT